MPIAACVVVNEVACLFTLLAKSTDERVFIAFRALPAASLVCFLISYSLANQNLKDVGLIGRDRLQRLAAVVVIAIAAGSLAGAIGCVMIMTLAT